LLVDTSSLPLSKITPSARTIIASPPTRVPHALLLPLLYSRPCAEIRSRRPTINGRATFPKFMLKPFLSFLARVRAYSVGRNPSDDNRGPPTNWPRRETMTIRTRGRATKPRRGACLLAWDTLIKRCVLCGRCPSFCW